MRPHLRDGLLRASAGRQRERGKRGCDQHRTSKHAECEGASHRAADRLAVEDASNPACERVLRWRNTVRAEQQARAFVPGDADEQLGIIGVRDIGGQHGVVGGFLAQLVGFAGEQPDERVEPEQAPSRRGRAAALPSPCERRGQARGQ